MAVRVYELSKELGVPSKELVEILKKNKFDATSHMSVVSEQGIAFVKKQFAKAAPQAEKKAEKIEKKVEPVKAPSKAVVEVTKEQPVKTQEPEKQAKIEKTVVTTTFERTHKPSHPVPQKISTPKPSPARERSFETKSQEAKPEAPTDVKKLLIQAMTVGEFAERTKKPISDVILSLIRKGILATKNQLITEAAVADLVRAYGMEAIQPQAKAAPSEAPAQEKVQQTGAERLPIVVVIGHVDHGKTTLLDFIRKTRVAAREKGGITQHLGAYEVTTKHGSLIFLDTPGHEAFSLMRVRGVKVADIAIVVIAADDGVMPQTIEAIRVAQNAKIPLVVALNKIDKVPQTQIDKVKHSLSQYGLVSEEWGGQTLMVPISAKLGQGIDTLLEILVLQAQMMELKAPLNVPAQGFVLEAKLEKGFGPVATVICQQGVLRVGDYITAGAVRGKVSVLINSAGAKLREVPPSVPALVAGFNSLPIAGESFHVVSQEVYKNFERSKETPVATSQTAYRNAATSEQTLNLIVKTDNASSLEAVLGGIAKLSGKWFKEFSIVHSGIGPISESDVMLAADTQALIYGFTVKVEPNAALLAQQKVVQIKLFDIIYKMFEDLEVVAEQGKPVKMVSKKMGEAVVLKVFDIKDLGVIAGAQVKSGIFVRNGNVVIWRGKYKVGKGPIKSLQRDRKTVKEVHTGFECAFLIDGFAEWEVDDRVECYLDVPEV